jgi:CubicO group peptidase (beta-lactamase class C family)
VFTNADFFGGLAADPKPLLYQPGDSGNYDNINYIVLAEIIARVSGQSYPDYIASHILGPAGMHNTIFRPLCAQLDITARPTHFAFPYLRLHMYSPNLTRANTVPYVHQYWCAYGFTGFGDYVSTTHDLLKYDEALYSGQLLDRPQLEEAFVPVLLNNGRANPDNFGLGWEIERDTSLGTIVYHGGYATGLSAVLLRNISRHQTVVVFDNTHDNAHAVT